MSVILDLLANGTPIIWGIVIAKYTLVFGFYLITVLASVYGFLWISYAIQQTSRTAQKLIIALATDAVNAKSKAPQK